MGWTDLDKLSLVPKSAQGDSDDCVVLEVLTLDTDDPSHATTPNFYVTENGDVVCATLTETAAGSEASPSISGTHLSIVDDTNDTENSALIRGNAITSGDVLKLFADTDLVTTGKVINVVTGATYAAATSKFSVDEDGDVIIAGTLSLSGAASAIVVPASSGAAGTAIGITTGAGNGGTATGFAGGAFSTTTGGGTAGTTTGGAGGASSITSGAGGTTATGTSGAGGAITFLAGAAGAASGAGTSGAAGAVSITAGASGNTVAGTAATGGAVGITAGASGTNTSAASGAGGAITLTPGASGTTTTGAAGASGAISLAGATGGNASGAGTGGQGSNISIVAGTGGTAAAGTGGTAGTVTLTAGNGGAVTGASGTAKAGGAITITTGTGGAITTGAGLAGGLLSLVAGAGGAGSTQGGSGGGVTIASGAAGSGGTGTSGAISIKQGGTGGTERIGISTAGAIGLTGNTTITGTATVAYGANDYMTITQADGGTCTFNVTSDGTAAFAFSDAVEITSATTAQLTLKFDAAAYMTITQADAAGVTFDSVSDGTAGFAFSDKVDITGVLAVKYDALAYMTITQADAGGVTFASTSDGTAGFTFSQAVTCSSTLGVTGITTLSANANITYSKTAAADVGTVRACYGKYALTGSTPVTTAANNMVGVRGEFNIATGGVLDFEAGSSFATGVQGKIVASGTTTIGADTSSQDARIQALHGQMDLTGMTINGGMVSILNLDMQVRPTAINGAGTWDFIHMADADVDKTAQANSFIYAYGEAAFLFDLYDPQANGADWIYGGAHTQASGSTECLKIRLNGTTYYIALYDATPGS